MTIRSALTWTGALLALGFTAPAALAAPADGARCFNGYAYTLQGDDYRYTEHHEQQRSNGRITTWDVDYIGTNGEPIAHKHMDFNASDTVPTYTLEIPANGYREGIRRDGEQWVMFRRDSADAPEKTQSFSIKAPMAADSGFDMLVRENFDRLAAGETVPFNFAAAGVRP